MYHGNEGMLRGWHELGFQRDPGFEVQQGVLREVRNFTKISYKYTGSWLHLRANDVNSTPISVYVYGNATPQNLTGTHYVQRMPFTLLSGDDRLYRSQRRDSVMTQARMTHCR